jgi:hypothetical protein
MGSSEVRTGRNTTARDETGLTVLKLLMICGGLAVAVMLAGFAYTTQRGVSDSTAKRETQDAATAASHFATETGRTPTASELAEYEPSLEYESLEPGDEVAVQGKVYLRVRGEVAELASRAGDTCYWIQEARQGRLYATGECDAAPEELRFTTTPW